MPGTVGGMQPRPPSIRELLRADLAVNTGLAKLTVCAIRSRQALHAAKTPAKVLYAVPALLGWWWCAIVIGADIPASVQFGPGLRLPHAGRGVVIHPTCVFGTAVTVYHRTTFGVRGGCSRGPRIGDRVYVGCAASVLGDVEIGPEAKIGAHALVLHDVGPGAVVHAPVGSIH